MEEYTLEDLYLDIINIPQFVCEMSVEDFECFMSVDRYGNPGCPSKEDLLSLLKVITMYNLDDFEKILYLKLSECQ